WTASLPEMLTEVVVGVERQIILELFIVLESAMQSDKLDKEMRLAALVSIYKDPTFNALAEGDPAFLSDYLTRFANERLLSREEFEAVAPQWVEANPRNGWAWHELALYLSSAD